MPEGEKKRSNPFKMLISGSLGGICCILVGYPLDTVKVRLQTMPRPEPGQQPIYSGTFDCIGKTIRNEGFLGLYKGMLAPLLGVIPVSATCFFGYGLANWAIQPDKDVALTYPQVFIAGSFSGLISTIITGPGERIKCLLQIQDSGGEKKYNGMLDTAIKLYKEGGLRSVYRGTCATLVRDLPANGVWFTVYEYLQDRAKEYSGKNDVGIFSTLFAGGVAGVCYWIVGMPADVLKSRLQTAPEGKYKHGIRSVFRELMAQDGPLALYRGITPVMLRAVPANAVTFLGMELANKILNRLFPNF